MRTKFYSVSVAAALLLILTSLPVSARQGLGARQFRRAERAHFAQLFRSHELREKLGLTNDQVTKLRDLRFDSAKGVVGARANLQTKRLELQQLMSAEKPDRGAIDRKIDEISEARSALMKNRVDHQLAVREILTPEQLEKLAELRAEFQRRRFERRMEGLHEPRPGGPPRPRAREERPLAPPNPRQQ